MGEIPEVNGCAKGVVSAVCILAAVVGLIFIACIATGRFL